ncbi:MAG: nucleotide sugar dehydrogenase [Candidatus Rokubacteria bacterium]|nr:nucleotide sugar dehydrogenase [Candidatus Rokubacteria bacterium]
MREMSLGERLRERTARITVVGQGYVGLPLAVEFARAGFSVWGLDSDPDRVAALSQGQPHSPDVPEGELREVLQNERYRPTSDGAALGLSDVVIICVPTPLRKSKDPDISYVLAAAQQAASHFRPGQLVVLESTTYPGTTEELLLPMFQAQGAVVGEDLFLAFSPERIDPGNPTFRVRDIPKVVGGVTPACTAHAVALYRHVVSRVFEVANPRVAEMAKLYENTFRNVNIGLANELAVMCRQLGVNAWDVIAAAATKPFGFMPFYPGPGIGGHCIGVDPMYLSWKLRLNGYEARFIRLADEINRGMPAYVVTLVTEALNHRRLPVHGSRILALGVSYKRGVGDTRESPALEVIGLLKDRGADVAYADPYVPSITVHGAMLKAVEVDEAELRAADCVVILTDHPDFDYRLVVDAAAVVVDTRRATAGVPASADRVVLL